MKIKAFVLLGIGMVCFWGYNFAYNGSLHDFERLDTAVKLLATVPQGMQKDIEKKLLKLKNNTQNEREGFCIQYLLYQLQ